MVSDNTVQYCTVENSNAALLNIFVEILSSTGFFEYKVQKIKVYLK